MISPGTPIFPQGVPVPQHNSAAPQVFVPEPTQPQIQQPMQAKHGQPLLPLVLLVLDGWGVSPASRGNAISLARTPNMNMLMQRYPAVTLHASGEVVGLPWAEMGNSEVGHLNIGTGKIIYQNLPMINKSISDGSFFHNDAFLQGMNAVKSRGSQLHLVGMVSDGGIHSSQDHLFAMLELCHNLGLSSQVFIHGILDGRDTPKDAALKSVAKLETKMHETGVGSIASLSGRFYAMDRDNHWERTEKAYNAMRHGKSDRTTDSPLKAIEDSYKMSVFDEEFYPTVVVKDDKTPLTQIRDNDVVIFFNFRSDRARQLTKTFVLPTFQKFDRGDQIKDLMFITMTEYEKNLPVTIAFQPDRARFTVARVVSEAGLHQLHIAETEKYAHVTFFFNGGSEEEYPNEDRVLIPSPRVTSYAETPAMSVHAIAERIVQEVSRRQYQFIVANFANADMVGHTGNLQATVRAIEEADAAVGRIAQAVLNSNGTLVVTADHGNAEEMINLQTGEIDKEHSTNPVPCIMANSNLAAQRFLWPPVLDGDLSKMQPLGVLSDVAPTMLQLMGLSIPSEMTSRSLIR